MAGLYVGGSLVKTVVGFHHTSPNEGFNSEVYFVSCLF